MKRDLPSAEERLPHHVRLEQMTMSGELLYEKEVDTWCIRAAIDLGLIEKPEFEGPDDRVDCTIKWDEKFEEWEFDKSLRTLLFAIMSVNQKKPDCEVPLTIALGRVLFSMKYLQLLSTGGERICMPPLMVDKPETDFDLELNK